MTSLGRPLVSFHLASNNAINIAGLFDNLERTASNPKNFEVLVKVDAEDVVMQEAMQRQAQVRPFAVRYISTPRGAGFEDLWKAYNQLLPLAAKDAYFFCLLSDEVRINEQNWDESLERYVGLFPDHIFRLRTTQLKLRNYYDFWECGFAPDSFSLYTRKWMEIVGDWNPCTGPDSSQQFIAYYLGFATYPAFKQYNRDVPILNITFSGEGASAGLSEEHRQRRNTINFRQWFVLVSHPMQEEFFRRARLLQAHIMAGDHRNYPVEAVDDSDTKSVLLKRRDSGELLAVLPYKISRTVLFFRNLRRSLHYQYYAGGGEEAWQAFPFSVIEFLVIYFPSLRTTLAAILNSKSYWITREVCRMVSWAAFKRQPNLLPHMVNEFSKRHPGWQKNHKIAHLAISLLMRIFDLFAPGAKTRS